MSGGIRRLYRGETNIDFIGKRKIWFLLSGLLGVGCALLLATRGLDLGIEFRGGVSIQAPIEDPGLADATVVEVEGLVRDAIAPFGAEAAQVQIASDDDGRSVLVQTEEGNPELQQDIVDAVAQAVGTDIESTDSQRIGSSWGEEITNKAVRALIVFIVVVFLFITIRFEWKMAAAAVLALVHDLLITAGIYSLVGFEVTPSTVVALLTILGYSLYDTVVVFDRVEENAELFATSGRMTYEDSANIALNQVFMRSLNTSLSTLLPVGALLFVGAGLLGAQTLQDLALALFIGLLVSAYSSVYVATPFLSWLKEGEPKNRSVRARREVDAREAAAAQVAEDVVGEEAEAPVPVTTTTRTARPGTGRPTAARARAGSKKARRRKRR